MDSSGMEYAREGNYARRSEAASTSWRTTSRTIAGPEEWGAAAVVAGRFIVTGGAAEPGYSDRTFAVGD
jgi:hypothetical protein